MAHNRGVASRFLFALLLMGTALKAGPAVAAPTAADILLVSNSRHPFSNSVADRYAALRGVPDAQRLIIDLPVEAVISRDEYRHKLEQPVARWLIRNEAADRILVILLGPGVPLRLAGPLGRVGTGGSVDTELALLYRKLTGAAVPASGLVDNPYFHPRALTEPRPFDRRKHDIYLVTRVDGRTEQEALALLDRADRRPEAVLAVVDGRPVQASGPEARWLADVGPRLQAALPGARVVADASADVVSDQSDVTVYVGWGSNDHRGRVPPVSFGRGAIASSFMSSDARTWAPPPETWVPGTWSDASTYFAGTPEALASDWLAAGLTGLGSQVAEPYLDGAFRPATLAEAWARGYTLAETFYLALPYLSWQGVVFGDPLARVVDPVHMPPPAETGGPLVRFLARAAAVLREGHPELGEAAARLMAEANLSMEQGRVDAARARLEEVTVRAPRYLAAHMALAQRYEAEKLHDLARARYQLVLGQEPADVVALNNLAYSLGVHAQQPAEALPFAERAAALGSNLPAVLDTLGWIRHLSGDSRGALGPLRKAVAGDESLCEAWEHLTDVERAVGNAAAADTAAQRAEACLAARETLR